jgi:carbonic anhydrase
MVRLIGLVVLLLVSGATIWAGFHKDRPAPESPPDTPEKVLAELKAGNERFRKSQRTRSVATRRDADRRKELAGGQQPFAALLSCADNPVAPEVIFDQRMGDIYDIRNPGNAVGLGSRGAIVYAVEELRVPLVVVLGHKGCAAMEAVSQPERHDATDFLRNERGFMTELWPEIEKGKGDTSAAFLDRLAEINARQQARFLLDEERMWKRGKPKTFSVAVGIYDMATGAVEWKDIGPEPKK